MSSAYKIINDQIVYQLTDRKLHELSVMAKAVRDLISFGMDSQKAMRYAVNTYNLTGLELKQLASLVFKIVPNK